MTQLELAKKGVITRQMESVAKDEGLTPSAIRDGIKSGRIVIPINNKHAISRVCGIGKGLSTKVNANLGTSGESCDAALESQKLKAAITAGADTVMDLSVGGSIEKMLSGIMKESTVPVGTVPVYEVANDLLAGGAISDMRWNDIERVLISQARLGVDFFTIHAGVTRDIVELLKKRDRILDVVSRGGSFIVDWIITNNRENPFYENFDRVLEIAREHDVTLSLGDGMRPGAIKDAGDQAQVRELVTLGGLARRSRDAGVQVMIEGPGHVPIHQIAYNIQMQKSLCDEAPFYVLGPLVTDIAPGYDHITGAIGGAIAAGCGADFLCYVTPSEHLRLPDIEDVKLGVIASRIAAHAADLAKGVKGAADRDNAMSEARKVRDWERQFSLAIDPVKPRQYRAKSAPKTDDVCSMCNEYCPIKIGQECLRK
jgi:phosphomethylpyrimidine synthase